MSQLKMRTVKRLFIRQPAETVSSFFREEKSEDFILFIDIVVRKNVNYECVHSVAS